MIPADEIRCSTINPKPICWVGSPVKLQLPVGLYASPVAFLQSGVDASGQRSRGPFPRDWTDFCHSLLGTWSDAFLLFSCHEEWFLIYWPRLIHHRSPTHFRDLIWFCCLVSSVLWLRSHRRWPLSGSTIILPHYSLETEYLSGIYTGKPVHDCFKMPGYCWLVHSVCVCVWIYCMITSVFCLSSALAPIRMCPILWPFVLFSFVY